MPEGTLINVNCPAGEMRGAYAPAASASASTATAWSSTRRRAGAGGTGSTARRPGLRDEDGTDFAAIGDGYIAVTPIHFDLTDHAGVEALSGFDLDAAAATGRARGD